jgi:hypothetical protein
MRAAADDVLSTPLSIPRAAHPPQLDDFTAGVPADAGVEVSDFRQNTPGDGEPVSLVTKVYLSYDDDHLYAVFVCKDDPSLVRARVTRREDFFGDEGVELFLDTFHDKQRAFVFIANPYGVQLDGRITEGLGYDFNFDNQWTSNGKLTADGYVVMMAIPFKSLRFEKAATQTWGVALGRIIPRLNETSHWPYITQRKEGFVPQFAAAEIAEEISPGRNIQLIPYGFASDTEALEVGGRNDPEIGSSRRGRAGIDAKFVIRDALAVDLTVNPDFSEVESDEPQVIVNRRFEVFFPEKRPFFLENASFFSTPVNLFFSRRILDPEYGARVTGRLGRWALGGLVIDDQEAGRFLPFEDHDERGAIGVVRVQRDFGEQSNVGVLVTDRRVGDHSNLVYALDSRVKLNESWAFYGQAVGSRTENNGLFASESLDGNIYFAELTRGGRNFTYDGQYLDVSDDFDTDLGFVPRIDIRQLYQTATYLWQYPDAPWLVSSGPTVTTTHTWDQGGELQDWTVDGSYIVNGLRVTKFEGHWIESFERFAGREFRKSAYSLTARSEWSKWLTAGATASIGEAINYVPAEGLQPFLGESRQLVLELTLSPLAQLRIDQFYIWDELRTRSGSVAGHPAGDVVFRDPLSRTKVNYQFNKFLALRAIVDYAAVLPDPELVALERNKRLTGDVLLSYVLHPGTAIYLGYTDRQENLRLLTDPPRLENTRGLDLHTGRQVFLKVSYLLQF